MSPDRLNEDQKLFYTVLSETWARYERQVRHYSRQIIIAICMIAVLLTGLTVGTMLNGRATVRNAARIISGLEERSRSDREMLLRTLAIQERADAERNRLSLEVERLKRDLARGAAYPACRKHPLPAGTR